jgi:hypothetical protein
MSVYNYSPLKAALEKLTIFDVWQRLGVKGEPGKNGKACRSPFRPDRNPSFSIYKNGNKWKDHATGEGGDAADFCAKARNLSKEEGARLLIDLAGTRRGNPVPQDNGGSANRQKSPGNPDPYDPFKDQEKARKRQGWPVFEAPTQAEIETVAMLRGLSPEGVALAAERDLLFCADTEEGRAWVITDSRRKNAQARRLDGKPCEHIGDRKAWTLPGSIGALPIGLYESLAFPHIALVEGGGDFLAAFHLAWCATSTQETLALGMGTEVAGKLGVIAMLGRHPIPERELHHFNGTRVRVFADADEPGLQAEGVWWSQLEAAGARVDGYSFSGFIRSDGKAVKDLNDFVLIDPDQWEAEREAIEEAFAFSA